MKKMYFLIVLFLTLTTATHSQCTGNSLFPATSVAVPTTYSSVIISTSINSLRYSLVTNAIAGQNLSVNTSLSTDYITVRSGTPTGPVLAYGANNTVNFANTYTGNIYIIVSDGSSCGLDSNNRILALTNNIPSATHLNFDGVDDRVTATNSNLPLGNTPKTLSAWVKTAQNNSGGAIVTFGDFGTNNRFALYQTGGKLNFVGQSNDYNTNVTINDNVWHHVAATHDGTNLKVYLDGVQVGTTQAKTFNTTGTQINIGHRSDNTEHFNGSIDEVRIWDRALSQTEIQNTRSCELQTAQTGIVAYYKFNQGSDSGTNTGVTSLIAAVGTPGTLTNFALSGATSNWLGGVGSPVTTGNICTTLGTNDFALANGLKLYPNPTKDIVNIEFNQLKNPKLEVFDINGRVILSQKLNNTASQINVANYPLGVYLFKITSDEGSSTSKVVKL